MQTPSSGPYNTIWNLRLHRYPPWVYMSTVFSPQECEQIIEFMKQMPISEGTTIKRIDDDNRLNVSNDTAIRKNRVSWVPSGLPETDWIFRKLTDVVNELNRQFYNFDLDYIESLQYTIYDQVDDHYVSHEDFKGYGVHYRKFSFSVQLSDPLTYEGCDLTIHDSGGKFMPTTRERGTLVGFPSFALHEVTPLISGTRISLVGWVCGRPFK